VSDDKEKTFKNPSESPTANITSSLELSKLWIVLISKQIPRMFVFVLGN
jgi:hypothetical protein